jgi:hypothetical protein
MLFGNRKSRFGSSSGPFTPKPVDYSMSGYGGGVDNGEQMQQPRNPNFFGHGGGWVDALGAFGDAFSGNGPVYAQQQQRRQQSLMDAEQERQKMQYAQHQKTDDRAYEQNEWNRRQQYERDNPKPINNDTANDLALYQGWTPEQRALYHEMHPQFIPDGMGGGQYVKPNSGGQSQPVFAGWADEGGQTPPTSGNFPVTGNVLDRATVQGESGGRRYGAGGGYLRSSAGAMGEWQVMPETARAPGFGIREWDGTPNDLARVGKDYRGKMQSRYGGDLSKMWAAYNAGPGRVDSALKKHGANWLAGMPKETRDYVAGMLKRIGR